MIVMPANSTGWFWHCLARETGRIGHLFSPGAQRGPWPWFSYALDNGAFSCWTPADNTFNEEKWMSMSNRWRQLLFWCEAVKQKPLWAIVPDRPGSAEETFRKWSVYAGAVERSGFPLALATQDGMTPAMVRSLSPAPAVICVGGSTEWKWATVEMWAREFKRVHLLRCNAPEKLAYLEKLGVESTDGTGWNRGDRKQTQGLEKWARGLLNKHHHSLWPFACRGEKKAVRQLAGQPLQQAFA